MIREFGLRNYYGFKEGVTISFALDANCPAHISNGMPFGSIMGVKGANASGKTTILRGITFLGMFAARSFNFDPDSPIPLVAHFDSPEPCELYVEFESNGVIYLYEASLKKEVVSETLYRTRSKKTKIVERKGNKLVSTIKEFESLKPMVLRPNVSFISTAKQYGIPGLQDVLSFFESIVSNVGFTGHVYDGSNSPAVAAELHRDVETREFVASFIKSIDVGVEGIAIHESIERDSADPDKEKKTYTPFFQHGSSFLKSITWHTESNGTRALFNRLPKIKKVLDAGGLLVADELDLHLHPMILPKLLGLFTEAESNPHGAQLLFTTHDDDVLDYLGKYRCYVVNKHENESFAYRLDELPGDVLRNDRPVAPAYRAGKVGGLPRI
ncbi:AAA family ATPase [Stenotrophomonas bentonitica]